MSKVFDNQILGIVAQMSVDPNNSMQIQAWCVQILLSKVGVVEVSQVASMSN